MTKKWERQNVLDQPTADVGAGTSLTKIVIVFSLFILLVLIAATLIYSLASKASRSDVFGDIKRTVTEQVDQGGKVVDGLTKSAREIFTEALPKQATKRPLGQNRETVTRRPQPRSKQRTTGSYDAAPSFTLDAPQLASQPGKTWVLNNARGKFVSEWRYWGRADGAQPAFMVGFITHATGLTAKPLDTAIGSFSALRRHQPTFIGERFNLRTRFGNVPAQTFVIAGSSGFKRCLGFYAMFDDQTRAIRGYACPEPNKILSADALTCLISKARHPKFTPIASFDASPCPPLSGNR